MLRRILDEFRLPPPQNFVGRQDLWDKLQFCEPKDVRDEIKAFGALLLAEVQARTAMLDSKAMNLLAWNGAISGLLLAALLRLPAGSLPRWIVVTGVVISALGGGVAFLALRVRGFALPSQEDWLALEFLGKQDANAISRRHILEMRSWHQADSEQNRWKAYWTKLSQWCLAIGVCALPPVVLIAALVP